MTYLADPTDLNQNLPLVNVRDFLVAGRWGLHGACQISHYISHLAFHSPHPLLSSPSGRSLFRLLVRLRSVPLGLTSESPWMISSNNNSRKKNDNDDVRDPITFTLGKKLNSATLACRGGVLESVCWVWLVVARSISLQPQT